MCVCVVFYSFFPHSFTYLPVFFPYPSPCLVQVVAHNTPGVFKELAGVDKGMREEKEEMERAILSAYSGCDKNLGLLQV